MTNLELKYTLFDTVEQMLAPETLSVLLSQPVRCVDIQPFVSPNGFSGNQLYYVKADEQKLVLKRIQLLHDWLSIASNDLNCRSVRTWQYGILDALQPSIQHGILAACHEDDDYAILMRDVSPGLVGWDAVTPQMICRVLDAQAGMHAKFWEDQSLKSVELGLSNSESIISYCWPTQWDKYSHDTNTVNMLRKGWESFFELVESDVRDAVQKLIQNPQPLFDALAKFPSTLIHADYRCDNLAILPDTDELIVFDWQLASYAPAVICLCWFLDGDVPIEQRDEYAAYYHQRLSDNLGDRFDQALWRPMLELGSLVEVLRKGNWHALFSVTGDDEEFKAYMNKFVVSYHAAVRKGLAWL